MELLAAVQEHEGLEETLLAFVNEIARAVGADRAAVGLVQRDAVRLSAMSHGAWFRRKSELAETIEAAMDEASDYFDELDDTDLDGYENIASRWREVGALAALHEFTPDSPT